MVINFIYFAAKGGMRFIILINQISCQSRSFFSNVISRQWLLWRCFIMIANSRIFVSNNYVNWLTFNLFSPSSPSTAKQSPLIKYITAILKKQNRHSKLNKSWDLFTRRRQLHTQNHWGKARTVGGALILHDSSLYIHSSYVAHVELMWDR